MSNPFTDRPRKPHPFRVYAVVDGQGKANAVRVDARSADSLALGIDGHFVIAGRFVPDDDARPIRPGDAVRSSERGA